MSLHQTFLHIDVGFALISIVATTLFVKLILQSTFNLLSPELLLCLDQMFRLCKQNRVDAGRRRLGGIRSLGRWDGRGRVL
jgi:hypothetical protein